MRQVGQVNGEIRPAFAKISTEVNALKWCVLKTRSVQDTQGHSLGSSKQQVHGDGNGRSQFGGSIAERAADMDRVGSVISRHRPNTQPIEEQFIKRADPSLTMSNTRFQQITWLLRQIQEQTLTRPTRVLGFADTRNEPSLAPMPNNSDILSK